MSAPFFATRAAEWILAHYADRLSSLCLIFPGYRPARFLLDQLKELHNQAFWEPEIIQVEDLLSVPHLRVPEHESELIAHLYAAYYPNPETAAESFDDFYSWGQLILNEFDQLDRYRVKLASFFTVLEEEKNWSDLFPSLEPEILERLSQFWGDLHHPDQKEMQEKFLKLWARLPQIYERFRHRLTENGLAYRGMLYRLASDNIENLVLPPDKTYLVIGFNALSTAEEVLFDRLKSLGNTHFLWDTDDYFLEDKKQEAGLFLRPYVQRFGNDLAPSKSLYSLSLKNENQAYIDLWGVPGQSNQTRILGDILSQIPENERHRTAIILPDASQLTALIRHWNPQWGEFNITEGWPLSEIPLANAFLALANTLVKLGETGKISLVELHALLMSIRPDFLAGEIEDLLARKFKYFYLRDIHSFPKFTSLLPDKSRPLSSYLDDWFSSLHVSEDDKWSKNKIASVLKDIEKCLLALPKESGNRIALRILNEYIRSQRWVVKGSNTKGFQIMGLLETRGLDFDTIVVLSMNEKIIPRIDADATFIPYILRKAFNLPTPERTAALSAYFFYRLLAKSKNVHLVYNNSVSGQDAAEPSRFILQLKNETQYLFREHNLQLDLKLNPIPALRFEKNAAVLETLQRYLSGNEKFALFPKHINAFIDCSLKFYFSCVENLKAEVEPVQQADQRIFGNAVHYGMEILFDNQLDKTLTAADWLTIKANIPTVAELSSKKALFEDKEVPQNFELRGEWKVMAKIVSLSLEELCSRLEYGNDQLTFLGSETSVRKQIDIPKIGKVYVAGKIDYTDKTEKGIIRIFDFKTGKDKGSHKKETAEETFSALMEYANPKRNANALQAYLYSWLMANEKPEGIIEPDLMYLRLKNQGIKKTKSEFLPFSANPENPNSSNSNYLTFEQKLKSVLQEIWNTDTAFEQTQNRQICQLCDFKLLCRR